MPNGTATLPEEQVKEEQRVRPSRREFGPGEGIGSLAGGVIAVVLAILAIAGLAGVYPLTLLKGPGDDRWVRIYGLVGTAELIAEYRKIMGKK